MPPLTLTSVVEIMLLAGLAIAIAALFVLAPQSADPLEIVVCVRADHARARRPLRPRAAAELVRCAEVVEAVLHVVGLVPAAEPLAA